MKFVALVLFCSLLLPQPAKAEQGIVFVSIPPQKYLLERLAGDDWQVATLLGPSANPHNYDPSARQLAALAEAHTYFMIGIPFESQWRERLQALNPDLAIYACGAEPHEHAADDQHDHAASAAGMLRSGHTDPHIWTSPIAAVGIVDCMTAALSALRPVQADVYTQRRDMLRQDLQELDQRIRVLLKDVSPRYLLVQHPAWDYFADAYDFEQISIERDGHEPNARHLVKVIEFARANKLDHVFVQRQYRQAAARIVAEAISAEIMHLDPLAENYIDNLYDVAVAIAQSNNNE